MRVNWVEQAPVLAQAGLDSLYDTYAFGREGDLKKGIVAGAMGFPAGLVGLNWVLELFLPGLD